MVFVSRLLFVAQRHEVGPISAVGQLGFHVHFAAAQHVRLNPGMKLGQVAVTCRTAPFIEHVKVAIEPEQRSEQRGIQKVHQRIQLIDAVLDGRAGQHERVAAAQALDGLRGFGVPILDALGFVQHNHVGAQPLIHVECVRASSARNSRW